MTDLVELAQSLPYVPSPPLAPSSTAVVVVHLDGRSIARGEGFTDFLAHAWEFVAESVARDFDCLPDDVGCDENTAEEGEFAGRDLVTVNGEAVGYVWWEQKTADGRIVVL